MFKFDRLLNMLHAPAVVPAPPPPSPISPCPAAVHEFSSDSPPLANSSPPAPAGSQEPVDVRVMSFAELFAKSPLPLALDSYQRPYVWGTDKADQLLLDLKTHSAASAPGLDYYMGAILLHRNHEKGALFVIDGQQRLTTLCLLHRVIRLSLPLNCALSYRNPESWRNIKINAERLNLPPSELPPSDIFSRIAFTVITVDSEDLAFTFFDTQNNRGVPLAATDLLKAFHLRAIGGQDDSSLALQQSCAARWEDLQNAPRILGQGNDFAPSLFQYFLWRGRCWTGRNVDALASQDDLIREFQERSVESTSPDTFPLYSSRGNRRAAALTLVPRDGYRLQGEQINLSGDPAELPFAIRQPVSAGVGFFLYTEKYAALARQLLRPDHPDPEVRAFQKFHAAVIEPVSVYLRELFLLASLMFVDQFGYRKLCGFALWLDHALGAIRIEKAYVFASAPLNFLKENPHNLLDLIAGAFRPEEPIAFLRGLPRPPEIYATRNVQGNGVQARYQQSVLAYYGKTGSLKGRDAWIGEKLKTEGLE